MWLGKEKKIENEYDILFIENITIINIGCIYSSIEIYSKN